MTGMHVGSAFQTWMWEAYRYFRIFETVEFTLFWTYIQSPKKGNPSLSECSTNETLVNC